MIIQDACARLIGARLSGNVASVGPAIVDASAATSNITITESVVSKHDTAARYGAISQLCSSERCSLTVNTSLISENAAERGAGIYQARGLARVEIENTVLSNNDARDEGGAVFLAGSGIRSRCTRERLPVSLSGSAQVALDPRRALKAGTKNRSARDGSCVRHR